LQQMVKIKIVMRIHGTVKQTINRITLSNVKNSEIEFTSIVWL